MGGGFGTGDEVEVGEGRQGSTGHGRATVARMSEILVWENKKTLPCFGLYFVAHYYAYLVDNTHTSTSFQVLENDQKMIWVARYVKIPFQILFKVLIQVMEESKVEGCLCVGLDLPF
jgi:hypothetical protein